MKQFVDNCDPEDGAVYAFIMAVPHAGKVLKIRSLGIGSGLLGIPVGSVSLLGVDQALKWKQNSDSLVIECPAKMDFAPGVVFWIE